MGLPKRLTEMQKRFAQYLVFNRGKTTGADAAIAAGYSPKRARVEASELQNPKHSPLVVEHIEKLKNEILTDLRMQLDEQLNEHLLEGDLNRAKTVRVIQGNPFLHLNSKKTIGNTTYIENNPLKLPENQINIYLAEEARPYHTGHFKIGKTTYRDVLQRSTGKTDNPYGLNYICGFTCMTNFDLEKALHSFFKHYSTYNKEYDSSASEWFNIKHRDKFIKTFKKVGYRFLEKNNCLGIFYKL